jgi:hypothetical protein
MPNEAGSRASIAGAALSGDYNAMPDISSFAYFIGHDHLSILS